jgi:Na+/proline symporter
LLGIIAASYASSDSALTSLTTSFCIDILNFQKRTGESQEKLQRTRHYVHLGFTALFFVLIVAFRYLFDQSVVSLIFKIAGFTYGPLLGLYVFGVLTKRSLKDNLVPAVCVLAPVLCFFLDKYSADLLGGFKFGNTVIIANALITLVLLALISQPGNKAVKPNVVAA